jgi:hypothetical protein
MGGFAVFATLQCTCFINSSIADISCSSSSRDNCASSAGEAMTGNGTVTGYTHRYPELAQVK